ncbi:MAG TPA: diaminopimelate epimerase [Candidatus Cloacimonetes bacterium]|nr:diaminopimelate epimerase [Candidatus Cloacimonadota bacterium]
MKLNFFKMQGQGNDYLFFYFLDKKLPDIDFSELAKKTCDRQFGVGADGIVIVSTDPENDSFMRIFNPDGSEAEMCGTALRCLVAYLYSKTNKKTFSINTKSGIKKGIIVKAGKNPIVKVDLGIPEMIEENILIEHFSGHYISLGNPHFVTFVENFDEFDFSKTGKKIETDIHFTHGTNVEFVKLINEQNIVIKFWERGAGATLACGTGTCAAVFSGTKQNLLKHFVNVKVPGGELEVEFDGKHIYLIGEVSFVFSGVYEI